MGFGLLFFGMVGLVLLGFNKERAQVGSTLFFGGPNMLKQCTHSVKSAWKVYSDFPVKAMSGEDWEGAQWRSSSPLPFLYNT